MNLDTLYKKMAAANTLVKERNKNGKDAVTQQFIVGEQAAAHGAMLADYLTIEERKLETKDAVKELLNSAQGKKIVSDAVYEGTIRALDERGVGKN
jgi:hypothetical protein